MDGSKDTEIKERANENGSKDRKEEWSKENTRRRHVGKKSAEQKEEWKQEGKTRGIKEEVVEGRNET